MLIFLDVSMHNLTKIIFKKLKFVLHFTKTVFIISKLVSSERKILSILFFFFVKEEYDINSDSITYTFWTYTMFKVEVDRIIFKSSIKLNWIIILTSLFFWTKKLINRKTIQTTYMYIDILIWSYRRICRIVQPMTSNMEPRSLLRMPLRLPLAFSFVIKCFFVKYHCFNTSPFFLVFYGTGIQILHFSSLFFCRVIFHLCIIEHLFLESIISLSFLDLWIYEH